MVNRLNKIDNIYHDQKLIQRLLPDIDNETVKIWLDSLLEDKSKMFVEELTVEEIQAEIEETKGSIDNFRMWGDRHAIVDCEEYIEVLEELLEEVTE